MATVTLNGHTYTDDSNATTGMANGGHRVRFIPCLSDYITEAFARQTTISASQTDALVSKNAAATSASNAATSASNAANQVTLATTQAGNASTSAGTATTQAEVATTKANDANNSAIAAAASAAAAAHVQIPRITRSSNTQLLATDTSAIYDLSGTFTQTIAAAAVLGAGWHVYLRNASNGNITIDPNGSELISGALTYVLKPGYSILLTCNNTSFDVLELKSRTYQNCIQYTSSGSFVVPADMYVLRAYAIGAGAAGTTAASGAGGGCAFGDIPVTPGETITFTIAAGVASVINQSITRLTGGVASGVTAGTASKHASVTNGGAYSGGAGYANAAAGGSSSGSPLGVGMSAAAVYRGGCGWGGVGNGSYGGGVGGAANPNRSGDGLLVPSTDPLLAGLVNRGATADGQAGAPGCGGAPGSAYYAGLGGFGGGGGYAFAGIGGLGGFGAGGGAAGVSTGGAGGYGGGGGGGVSGGGGAGGAAVIRIYF